jgi:hypothetical protein
LMTAAIDTFISDVSTTSTNMAAARRTGQPRVPAGSARHALEPGVRQGRRLPREACCDGAGAASAGRC